MFKILKKGIVICALVGTIMLISSCDLPKSDDEIVEGKIQTIITLLENKDKENIKNLFAKTKINTIGNFDQSLDELLKYYDGEYQSKRNDPHGKFRDKDGDFCTTWFLPSFDVTTSKDTYRIAFYLCTEYTTDSDSVGIWSLYIIKKSEDTTPESAYGGDGLWTPGINIGKVYVEDK